MKYKGRNTIGRPVGQSKSLGQRVPTDARFDGKEHYLELIQTQRRCANCGLKTKSICSKCNVAVHSRCFREFHTHTAWTVLSLLTHFYIHFIFLTLLRHYLSDVVSCRTNKLTVYNIAGLRDSTCNTISCALNSVTICYFACCVFTVFVSIDLWCIVYAGRTVTEMCNVAGSSLQIDEIETGNTSLRLRSKLPVCLCLLHMLSTTNCISSHILMPDRRILYTKTLVKHGILCLSCYYAHHSVLYMGQI